MLSIIMPVYNTGEYLRDSALCVLSQEYRDLELIMVDDGSTDDSGLICDQMAERDSRVRVIHKKNGGVASARNAGVDAAKGDYIGWVDSDDLIAPSMFRLMMELAQQYDADIVQCAHVRDPQMLPSRISDDFPQLEVLGPIDSLKRIYCSHYTNACALWSKIFRRSLFEGVRFTEGAAFEDDEIVPQLLYKGKVNVFFELPLYCYVKRENSIITTPSAKNLLALTRHLENRMLWFRELDQELFITGKAHFFHYLKRKMGASGECDPQVLDCVIGNLKRHTCIFWKKAHPFDKVALLLLRLPGGKGWVIRTGFEPVQSLVRKVQNRK